MPIQHDSITSLRSTRVRDPQLICAGAHSNRQCKHGNNQRGHHQRQEKRRMVSPNVYPATPKQSPALTVVRSVRLPRCLIGSVSLRAPQAPRRTATGNASLPLLVCSGMCAGAQPSSGSRLLEHRRYEPPLCPHGDRALHSRSHRLLMISREWELP